MTFGNLTALYQAIKDAEVKRKIAKTYNCSLKVFINYLETIRVIRNKCAHGSCLYNMDMAKGIKIMPARIDVNNRHNIKGAFGVIRYMLGVISKSRAEDLDNALNALLKQPREAATDRIIRLCTNFSL